MSMNEQSVREYLLQHPDFMQRHPDVLPVAKGKVKDFRDAQLAKMQADNQLLKQRQQQWVNALHDNQHLSSAFWQHAADLARCNSYKQVLAVLEHMLFEELDFPIYALKLMPPSNKRPVPEENRLQAGFKWIETQAWACAHLPKSMNTWLPEAYESHLVLPLLRQGQFLGVWVLASKQVDYFHPEQDTTYLKAFVQVLSATLARIMGVAD